MKYTVFYSWQSDLPNNTNRGFLQSVIETSIKNIHKNECVDLEVSFDRDTQGVPGSPNISQAIIEKIKSCDAFVADVSIVTGDKEKGLRVSPNPNVLIELGYAIGVLGWGKIILLCNSSYGDNEDLPFDIRQHRRVSYSLMPEDPKAPVRKELARNITRQLIDILEDSQPNSMTKRPELSVGWVRDIQTMPVKKQKIDILEVYRAKDVNTELIKIKVNANLESITNPDATMLVGSAYGSATHTNRNWDRQVETFRDECSKFIENIDSENGKVKYLLEENAGLVTFCSLNVFNRGTLPASDIRVKFLCPEWLIVFAGWPNDIPRVPEVPKPKSPIVSMIESINVDNYSHTPLNYTGITKESGIAVNHNDVSLWADKLLHRHELTFSDKLLLLARPEADLGTYTIVSKVFCVEYDDWREVSLTIEVKEAP